ncbi:MAG: diguanylate cyclase [Saccharospirillaceae bacterium]|nr:diguanylate cyclase [Saccharospirillaceae bacterium]MCD8530283.1 diguanylate cyclase [Saccharospirillaceae bacterium]
MTDEIDNPGIKRLLAEIPLLNRRIQHYQPGIPITILAFGTGTVPPSLAEKIRGAGYRLKEVESISHLLHHEGNNTCALIVNLDALNNKQQQRVLQLAQQNLHLPVLAISTASGLEERIIAIRMGAQAFITTPVNDDQVLEEIHALTERYERDPYQVLIVDDQPSVAEFLASTLQEAGFVTHVITRPMTELMPYLQNHLPDLILLDLYMPGISGQELAGVIRQQDSLISVPIVFLSNEISPKIQVQAMCTGADVFLTKPVQPLDLLFAVESRIRRGRMVRNLVTRDSLTALLNRRESMRRLQEEVLRCQRYGNKLCVALLDLDRFKQINDTHGHAVGDRVIKHFALLLKNSLRDGDIVGRIGGEEFMAVLPETTLAVARQTFVRMADTLKENPFGHSAYTFSGGLVRCLPGMMVESLLEQADAALYSAKEAGRDQIVCVEPSASPEE